MPNPERPGSGQKVGSWRPRPSVNVGAGNGGPICKGALSLLSWVHVVQLYEQRTGKWGLLVAGILFKTFFACSPEKNVKL